MRSTGPGTWAPLAVGTVDGLAGDLEDHAGDPGLLGGGEHHLGDGEGLVGPTTWTGLEVKSTVAMPPATVAVTVVLAGQEALEPEAATPRRWVRRAGPRGSRSGSAAEPHVPRDRDQVWFGATRKIGLGHRHRRAARRTTVVGRDRVEQMKGDVGLGDGCRAPGGWGSHRPRPSRTRAAAGRQARERRVAPVHAGSSVPDGRRGDEGQLDDEPATVGRGHPRSTPRPRGGGRARRPGTARARCPRSMPAVRPGCPGRSARRGGGARRRGIPGPWSSTMTRMLRAAGAGWAGGWRSTMTRVTPPA